MYLYICIHVLLYIFHRYIFNKYYTYTIYSSAYLYSHVYIYIYMVMCIKVYVCKHECLHILYQLQKYFESIIEVFLNIFCDYNHSDIWLYIYNIFTIMLPEWLCLYPLVHRMSGAIHVIRRARGEGLIHLFHNFCCLFLSN